MPRSEIEPRGREGRWTASESDFGVRDGKVYEFRARMGD